MLKYEEIADSLIRKIKSGEYQPQQKIPSENQLADIFETSRMTVRKGVSLAITRGYLHSIQGKGTYVVDDSSKIEVDLNNLDGFTKRTLKLGKKPSSKVVALQFKETDVYSKEFFGDEFKEVLYLERIRYMDETPLAVEYGYINPKYASDISLKDVSNSFETYMESKGIKIKSIKKEFKAVIPDSTVVSALHLEANTPVIRVNFLKYLDNGDILEYIKVFYNQNIYKIVQNIEL